MKQIPLPLNSHISFCSVDSRSQLNGRTVAIQSNGKPQIIPPLQGVPAVLDISGRPSTNGLIWYGNAIYAYLNALIAELQPNDPSAVSAPASAPAPASTPAGGALPELESYGGWGAGTESTTSYSSLDSSTPDGYSGSTSYVPLSGSDRRDHEVSSDGFNNAYTPSTSSYNPTVDAGSNAQTRVCAQPRPPSPIHDRPTDRIRADDSIMKDYIAQRNLDVPAPPRRY